MKTETEILAKLGKAIAEGKAKNNKLNAKSSIKEIGEVATLVGIAECLKWVLE